MVKFGRHLQFFLELEGLDTKSSNHYIVPYSTLRDAIENDDDEAINNESFQKSSMVYSSALTPASFEESWRDSLSKSNSDLRESINTCWKSIFDFISAYQDEYPDCEVQSVRGLELMDALKVYTQINDIASSMDVLCFLKDTYNVAEMNYQALRKIVKKFDKKYHAIRHHDGGSILSVSLLPELYSSTLFVGRGTLEMTISFLRSLIEEVTSTTSGGSSDEGGDDDIMVDDHIVQQMHRIITDDEHDYEDTNNNEAVGQNKVLQNRQAAIKSRGSQPSEEDKVIKKRNDEMQWLGNIVKTVPPLELKHIVAHRGFHASQGRSDYRPLENSLFAFESAWSAGIHLCECDVALTKDEKLVLAHDEDFNRLALDRSSHRSRLKISELTFKELIALTLKNGVRAPLLKDVLMSANAIGPQAKLIIEIKPGNSEAGMAIARFLVKYPELIPHVAVIMSFDLWCMHLLCAELHRVLPAYYDSADDGLQGRSKSASLLDVASSPGEPAVLIDNSSGRYRSNSLIAYQSPHENVPLPKLMLLTVADQSENRFELCVDVSDYSPIDGWLNSTSTSLDGVYVRCQPDMLLPKGRAALRALAEKYVVGIWGKAGEDPDDHRMIHYLVKECGVSFINTDLPRSF